ncbi:hypothetical protein [Pseudofrankia sp. DC12]|uniref:hypothetical protein n=1 Tax=Pseudofrankia sp. DC12 TaxID=683315 RepID=UPI000A75982B|nr:hypothetical protein [Pseudofrankia sp. DC12]
MDNQFEGRCASCSVMVHAQGGLLRAGPEGWEVLCAACRVDQIAPGAGSADSGPQPPPAGCAATIRVRILGMKRLCWKCGEQTLCVVGLYPKQPARGYQRLPTTDTDETIALAQWLLRVEGRPEVAETIKTRYSQTVGGTYLANTCRHCDALQGNFPVQEEVLACLAATGLGGLETLVEADCPIRQWQAVLRESGFVII